MLSELKGDIVSLEFCGWGLVQPMGLEVGMQRYLDMHAATRKTALLHSLQFMQCEIMLQIPIRDR